MINALICKECPKRQVGCYKTCKEYQKLVKKMLKMKEENKETKIELYISDNEKIIITLNTTT